MKTTLEYLTDLRLTTLEYANKWQIVASKLGIAYTAAFEKQKKKLAEIKKAIEEHNKREEAMMSLTLSLLTGGLVGPVADKIAGKAFKYVPKGSDPALADLAPIITRDGLLTDWTSNAFKELAKAGDEKLIRGSIVDQLKPPEPTPSGFEAASMTPGEFVERMRVNMIGYADAMSDTARYFFRSMGHISPELAAGLHSSFTSNTFFTSLPKTIGELGEKQLQRCAEVMLWIAWGKVRKLDYWEVQNGIVHYPYYSSESWHWAPLLKELEGIGVPVKPFVVEGMRAQRWQRTIDMPAFIKWARGSTAGSSAFLGLPLNDEGRKLAELRLTLANTLI